MYVIKYLGHIFLPIPLLKPTQKPIYALTSAKSDIGFLSGFFKKKAKYGLSKTLK